MDKILKFKRGNTAKNTLYAGADGELTVDTSKKTVVVHDGVTAGGSVLATESLVGTKINAAEKGVANGVSTLDVNGKVVLTQMPTYVTSVAGKTGVVTLEKGDVGLGNVQNVDTTNATNISSGTLNASRLANSGVTAGTYRSVTTDAKGRITAGTNPTTVAGYGLTDVFTKTEIQETLPAIGLDTMNTVAPTRVGQLKWNQDENTADLAVSGAVLQIGQELVVNVRNSTGITIPNGTVVMATGSIGNSGRITVAPHDGTIGNAINILGVTTQSIVSGEDGTATLIGKIREFDTTGIDVGETWVDGTKLYVKPNDGGKLTSVEPLDTETKMAVAYVVHAHTNGTLYVRVLGFDENHFKAWTQAELDLKADITYVDTIVGDINSALDTINGEVI